MGTDVISICNRSLLAVGARNSIASLTEGSTESDACNILYSPTFEALGRAANWACLRKQATLTLLAAAQGTMENPNGTTLPLPPTPWLYSYAYPSDCLRVRYLLPNYSANGGGVSATTINNAVQTFPNDSGQINYAVAYDTDNNNNPITIILTNQSQAQAVYTIDQPNPIIWDSQFQAAMVAALAAYLVPALSLSMSLMQMTMKTADGIITAARVSDANEGVTVMDHLPDFIRARGYTGGYAQGWNAYGNQFDAMVWPGGF